MRIAYSKQDVAVIRRAITDTGEAATTENVAKIEKAITASFQEQLAYEANYLAMDWVEGRGGEG
jgi:hypothetical protein